MSILNNSLLLGADAGAVEYQIQRSLRFNSSDSAYLSRTPASAGNRKTWTWSGWAKRSGLGNVTPLFSSNVNGAGNPVFFITIESDKLLAQGGVSGVSVDYEIITQAVFRDCSAWMHIVYSFDSTVATAADRTKLYVNGARITAFNSTPLYPSLDYQGAVNNVYEHRTGRNAGSSYGDFYLADINFIDGQALDPTSFAETNITTGQWVPKAYTGTYGTNGFRLAFADNSNNTATTLGKDTSGNGNNWTPNNLSVTAGAGNDSLVDTPTSYGTDTGAGGSVRGNYATLNPVDNGGVALANGNLDIVAGGTSDRIVRSTIGISSGKWYWEATGLVLDGGNERIQIGIASFSSAINTYLGNTATSYGYLSQNGNKYNSGSAFSYGSAYTAGDLIGVAFDADNGTLTFYKNNVSQGTAFTGLTAGPYFPAFAPAAGGSVAVNFGQRPFAYTAPSGFKALCDTNLPAPVVAKPNTAFDVALWTGNGSARSITGLNFNPDFVWIKGRSGATDHALYDVVRGTEKRLESNTTDAEVTSDGGVTAFNSDGFSLGTLAQVNTNSSTYVGWAWDGGTSTVTNTQGSITSQVRANASAGFSIVTYTGNGTTNKTVGHGLNTKPGLILVKCRNTSDAWNVYHSALGANYWFNLNTTGTPYSGYNGGSWNNTEPTSSVFTVNLPSGYSTGFTNENGINYVAYVFSPVAGYSSFGSYTGNGSTDGPFVYTGFRPRWILFKNSSAVQGWCLVDTARSTFNLVDAYLQAHASAAEASGFAKLDIVSNGFKVRDSDAFINGNTNNIIYAAFAENPFQYARAR